MLEAEGLIEHEPNKGARVPRLTRHEVDVIYRMRERLEPLALAESLPRLDRGRPTSGSRRCRSGSRTTTDIDGSSTLDREFHLLHLQRLPRSSQLTTTVARLWNSTQHYRRAFMQLTGAGAGCGWSTPSTG